MKKSALVILLTVGVWWGSFSPAWGQQDLAEAFAHPPDASKPRVYWWWLHSRVNRAGITRDLEEYRAKGVGGVLLFDAGGPAGPMPAGPRFMSPEWRELFKHALREADRLGIEVSVNLCSGWDAGGPWITPDLAAHHFTQSQLVLAGPRKFSGPLPMPAGDAAHYHDAAVQAIREPPGHPPLPAPRVTASSAQKDYPASNAADGNDQSFWVSDGWHPGDSPTPQKPEWLQFDFPEPITIGRLRLLSHVPYGPRELELQVSADGQHFSTLKAFSLPNREEHELVFPSVSSRVFRILVTGSYATQNTQISEASWGDQRPPNRALLQLKSGRDSSPLWSPSGSIRSLVEAPLAAFGPGTNSVPITSASIIDLTDHLRPGGQFEWDVPEGTWTILRTGYTTTGARVSCASPGGEGYEMDWLNAAAMDHHFRSMAEVLIADAGPLAGRSLKYFHDDSWEVGLPNWTDGFLDEFKKYRGYDGRIYLPVLAGRVVVSSDISDRFLYDFRKTIADCLAENHYARFAELAHEKGLKIHCEAGGPCWPKAPPMDALRNLGRCDVPMGEFWQSAEWKEGGQNHATKQIACAAHIYGRTYVAAEAFTKIGPHYEESPAELKPTADIAFCEGINRFFLHTSSSSCPEDGQPGFEYFAGTHFNRNVTWWEQSGAFLAYVGRCQYLLQQGLFVGDVLFYNGDNAPNFVEVKHVDPALGRGYDYDVCNSEVLLKRLAVQAGRLVLPDGMNYRLLVLPDRRSMPLDVLRKVADLVAAGATAVGPKPSYATGLTKYPDSDRQLRKLADELWGDADGTRVTQHKFGRGRVVWGRSLRELLGSAGVPPDFEFSGNDLFLDYIHRTTEQAEIYFVPNRQARAVQCDCTFRVTGRHPELWDPVTGTVRPAAAFHQDGGRTTLPLEFAPHGSIFVVFRNPISAEAAGAGSRNFPNYVNAQELAGDWTVKFDPKWGGPETVQFAQLVSWTQRPEPGVRNYSGKATYYRSFDLPNPLLSPGQEIVLDLGKVKNLAAVRLNGQELGVAWTAPFRIDITKAVKPAGNRLEIDVVNLWRNRLIGDAALPPEQQLTRGNVKLGKGEPLLESGLLGPVTLQVAERPGTKTP